MKQQLGRWLSLLKLQKSGQKAILVWLLSLGFFIAIVIAGYYSSPDSRPFFNYFTSLYLLDSLIFFALLGEKPKMKLAMLTFIFLLEVIALGYYLLVRLGTAF